MASGLSSFDKEGMPGSVPGPRRGWLELVRDGQTVACRTTLSSASSRPPLFIRAEFYPQLFDTGDGEVAQSCFLRLCGIWQRPAMAGGIGQSLKAAESLRSATPRCGFRAKMAKEQKKVAWHETQPGARRVAGRHSPCPGKTSQSYFPGSKGSQVNAADSLESASLRDRPGCRCVGKTLSLLLRLPSGCKNQLVGLPSL
jgi:hypothetical protein